MTWHTWWTREHARSVSLLSPCSVSAVIHTPCTHRMAQQDVRVFVSSHPCMKWAFPLNALISSSPSSSFSHSSSISSSSCYPSTSPMLSSKIPCATSPRRWGLLDESFSNTEAATPGTCLARPGDRTLRRLVQGTWGTWWSLWDGSNFSPSGCNMETKEESENESRKRKQIEVPDGRGTSGGDSSSCGKNKDGDQRCWIDGRSKAVSRLGTCLVDSPRGLYLCSRGWLRNLWSWEWASRPLVSSVHRTIFGMLEREHHTEFADVEEHEDSLWNGGCRSIGQGWKKHRCQPLRETPYNGHPTCAHTWDIAAGTNDVFMCDVFDVSDDDDFTTVPDLITSWMDSFWPLGCISFKPRANWNQGRAVGTDGLNEEVVQCLSMWGIP